MGPVVHNHSFTARRCELTLRGAGVTDITKFSCSIDKWSKQTGKWINGDAFNKQRTIRPLAGWVDKSSQRLTGKEISALLSLWSDKETTALLLHMAKVKAERFVV